MEWTINFITEDDFREHVKNTIKNYGDKLKPYNVTKFNSNIVDPIKMVFDKAVYGESWNQIISNEIFRQRDKSNSNEIGYFHQKLFKYISNCEVPDVGWDIVYKPKEGFAVGNSGKVSKIYVELKNKHNTMNSSSAAKTYMKMQNQLLSDDDCACFLVEAIAKRSQNIIWATTVDNQKVSHNRIRRVSIDKFYEIVTGEADAFLQICLALPIMVQEILSDKTDEIEPPKDTVYDELKKTASEFEGYDNNKAMFLSMYILGFRDYNGFKEALTRNNNN